MSLVNNQALVNYIKTYHNQLDNIYIDKFWSSINNKQWIYADDTLIEWIGYKKDNGKFKYTNLIRENFKENEDYKTYNYKEINKVFHSPLRENENNKEILEFKDKLKEVHNRTIHLILSPKCFKKSLMMIRTEKANSIRDYYVDIEEVCLEFNKFLLEESKMSLETKNKELEAEKNKNTNLTNNAIDYNQLLKKEYLYIATNTRYASQNNFKIGKTTDPEQRLRTFNTSHNKKEHYYYVFLSEPTYNAKSIEYIIKHILTKFKNSDTNEIYVVHYTFLEKIVKNICENYNASVDFYNKSIQEEMENMSNIPVIPKDIFNVNNIKTEKEEVKEMEYQGENVEIEYYDNNKEYEFIRFKSKDKNMNYKCNRCNHIFNRTDHLQLHFQRQTKCYDSSKNEKIESLKKNKASPTIKYYRDNQEYNYHETFLESDNCINYHCGRCDYETTNLPSLKKHFDRKVKCYEVKTYSEYDPNNIEIEILNNNKNHQFYRFMEDGVVNLQCNHCNYKTIVMGNLNRHFKGKKKCWENKD